MGLWTRLRLSPQPDGTSPWWGIAILLVGVVLALMGYLWEGTWEDVFIEVGAAAGVGGIVLLFKPRLMRQVDDRATKAGATAAEDIASTRTEAIEKRLVKLESLSEIQATELDRKQAEAARVISTVGADASHANVQELLIDAYGRGLFVHNLLVRTSNDMGTPLLRVTQDILEDDPQIESVILFDILYLPEGPLASEKYRAVEEDAVHWSAEHDAQTLVRELIDNFTRANLPHDKRLVQRSLSHLRESYRLMVAARDEPRGSSKRLKGKLVLLINDEWALT